MSKGDLTGGRKRPETDGECEAYGCQVESYRSSIVRADLLIGELERDLTAANERVRMTLDAKNHWMERAQEAKADG